MKKTLTLFLSLFIITAFFTACAQQQVKTEDKPEDQQTQDMKVKSDSGADFAINAINSQVSGFSIDGFPGGSAKLSKNEDLENMKKIVSIVKPIIEKIPDGYVMQITGHAADYGTSSGQNAVSVARALKIYTELKNAGVPASKMKYNGVGTSEPISGVDAKDPKQRRVSFKALKK